MPWSIAGGCSHYLRVAAANILPLQNVRFIAAEFMFVAAFVHSAATALLSQIRGGNGWWGGWRLFCSDETNFAATKLSLVSAATNICSCRD